ncbi:MAG: SUMF1/EgtB/PvdO family nonheme iron enzyme [Spirochaetales bacterium]|nr:SUMF1/EgtB/PvdO family nonheme iron enzyme [Spirochaetales bacterium]
MKNAKEPLPDFKDVKVSLKNIFGFTPQVYVPVIWGILIVLLLFFLLFFPGIIKNGSYILFKSYPEKSLLYLDEKLMGTTPCEIFVPSGKHKLEVIKPFYTTYRVEEAFKGSLFASLFFPLKSEKQIFMKIANSADLINNTKIDFSRWGMLKEFTKTYPFAPIFSDFVKLYQNSQNSLEADQINDLINSILPFVDSPSEAYDVLNGFSRLYAEENPLGPVSMIKFLKSIISIKQKAPLFAYWLVSFLPIQPDSQYAYMKESLFTKLVSSPWFQQIDKQIKENGTQLIKNMKAPRTSKAKSIGNIDFIMINPDPNSGYMMGNHDRFSKSLSQWENAFPHWVKPSSFAMAGHEVTNREYYQFTMETPIWHPNELDYLLTKNWVTKSYLSHWLGGKPKDEDWDKAVTNVSWEAAKAFCDWLEDKADFKFEVRLPTEIEWEYSAYWDTGDKAVFERTPVSLKASWDLEPGNLGFKGLLGNTWEWLEDDYAPLGFQLNISSVFGSEKVVRGGSYMNIDHEEIKFFTRGSQIPTWSSEFLGFRPVYQVK